MPARKFKFDHKLGIMVETTDESTKAVCDEISKSVEKYKQPLEFGLPKGRRKVSLWPRYNEFLGVHPSQRQEAIENSIELGVPTEFNEHGDPYFVDRNHENRYIRATGHYHRNAGYGDVAPNHFVQSTHGRKVSKSAVAARREEIKHEIARLEREIYLENHS